jgi:outer membrane immunogenic protein
MRQLIIGSIAAIALACSQSAFGADMAVKAPLTPPPASYNWTGFYVGGNVGYSWGNSNTAATFTDPPNPFLDFTSANAPRSKGVIGGGQIGYNWQASPNWVLGLEADWQGTSEKAALAIINPFNIPFFAIGSLTTSYETKMLWVGTARGRIGYAWDRLLFYGTGGLAYGEVKVDGTVNLSAISLGGPVNTTAAFGHSNLNAGWTLGGGVEGAIVSNWTWKVEYLYINLGSLNMSAPGPSPVQTLTLQARFTDNIVRAGVNARF